MKTGAIILLLIAVIILSFLLFDSDQSNRLEKDQFKEKLKAYQFRQDSVNQVIKSIQNSITLRDSIIGVLRVGKERALSDRVKAINDLMALKKRGSFVHLSDSLYYAELDSLFMQD